MVGRFAVDVGQTCGRERFTRRKEERRNKVTIERDQIVRWLKA